MCQQPRYGSSWYFRCSLLELAIVPYTERLIWALVSSDWLLLIESSHQESWSMVTPFLHRLIIKLLQLPLNISMTSVWQEVSSRFRYSSEQEIWRQCIKSSMSSSQWARPVSRENEIFLDLSAKILQQHSYNRNISLVNYMENIQPNCEYLQSSYEVAFFSCFYVKPDEAVFTLFIFQSSSSENRQGFCISKPFVHDAFGIPRSWI